MDTSPTAGDGNKMDLLLDMVREMSKSINSDDKKIEKVITPLVKRWPEYCSE